MKTTLKTVADVIDFLRKLSFEKELKSTFVTWGKTHQENFSAQVEYEFPNLSIRILPKRQDSERFLENLKIDPFCRLDVDLGKSNSIKIPCKFDHIDENYFVIRILKIVMNFPPKPSISILT